MACLGKCYWNEPDGRLVRELARQADGLYSSAICIAGMACQAHRKVREGPVTAADAAIRRDLFLDDGLHLSPAGYQVWAERLAPYRNKIVIEDCRNIDAGSLSLQKA